MSVKSGSITFNIYTDRDNSLALSDLKLFYTELSDNDIKELNDNILYIVQYMKLTKNVKEKYTSVLGLYLEFYNLQVDNTLGDLKAEDNKIYVLIDGDQITVTLKYKEEKEVSIIERTFNNEEFKKNHPDSKEVQERPMGITNPEEAKAAVSDIIVAGDPGAWKVISKASSESQQWMKSTKGMVTETGVLVQVTTKEKGQIAEALTFIPGARMIQNPDGTWRIK